MIKLTIPLNSNQFIDTLESLDRSQRPEYIFENLWRVIGGNETLLVKYAIESRVYWENRCCSMLEYSSTEEFYSATLQGKLPKTDIREKEAILRLTRALCDEMRLNNQNLSDDTALEVYYKTEALLKHINNKNELLKVYVHLPNVLRKQNFPYEFLTDICTKALTISRELALQEYEMQALNNFGNICESNRDFNSAIGYYTQAHQILDAIIKENNIDNSAQHIPDEYLKPKATLLYSMGNCKGILGSVRDTVIYCSQAAEYAKRMETESLCVHIQLLLARAYSILGSQDTALEHLDTAASYAESMKSDFLTGQTKMFVAVTYSKLGDFKKAIEYGLEAIPVYKQYESISEYFIVCGRVGTMMVSAGEYERAKSFFTELLQSIENADPAINLEWQKLHILRELARISISNQDWNDALYNLQQPLQAIENENKLPHLVAETTVVATDAYIGASQYEKAAEYAEHTLRIGLQCNDLRNQYTAHQQLATIAEKKNDIATAYHHFKEFHRLKEQAFNDESDRRNKNMQMLLEEKEALRIAQAERLKRYELEDEIGQLSSALVYREQALKEIRSALRSMSQSNEQNEQVMQVLQTVLRTTERSTATISTKTYKTVDEMVEKKFPGLSRVQRELARFIVLGYSTKDIAGLMGISVQSVHTQRYRVRTRLGLGEDASLDQVIKMAVKQL